MRWILLILLLAFGAPAGAVQPDEILADPALEERAREISKELRCVVCRNQSIDDSNAGIARDMRLLVRERLLAGDSDAEVVQYMVDRYGEYVLLTPQAGGSNLVLWMAGPLLLLGGLVLAAAYLRRSNNARNGEPAPPVPLSDEERARLDRLLER